ncbi:hypothetical protein C5748_25180 [Phyllobacterium phragmitis]|uniref:Uncharacterized protein n=1 Tax=Phyllobacterium phragmitis TaxID=2670329 RepID=A0A2S9IJT9_9HYPH|nr:calcium-binding protein [Phyllobacterium phragmitis]PRD40778.1 hypothetical protein C5748_25180 [Phyllobacterium phragmitis]
MITKTLVIGQVEYEIVVVAEGNPATSYQITVTAADGSTRSLNVPVLASSSPIRDVQILDGGDSVLVWALSQNGEVTVTAHDPNNLSVSIEATRALSAYIAHGAGKFVAISEIDGKMVMVDAQGYVHTFKYENGLGTLTRSAEKVFDPSSVNFDKTQALEIFLGADASGAPTLVLRGATGSRGTGPMAEIESKPVDLDRLNRISDVRDGTVPFGGDASGVKIAVSNGRLLYSNGTEWKAISGFGEVSQLQRVEGGVTFVEAGRQLRFLADDTDLAAANVETALLLDVTANAYFSDAGYTIQASDFDGTVMLVLDSLGMIRMVVRADDGETMLVLDVNPKIFAGDVQSGAVLTDVIVKRIPAGEPGAGSAFPYKIIGVASDGSLVEASLADQAPQQEAGTRELRFTTANFVSGYGTSDGIRFHAIESASDGTIVLSGTNAKATIGSRDFVAAYDTGTGVLSDVTRALQGGSIGMPLQIAQGDIRIPNSGEMFTVIDGEVHYFNALTGAFEGTGLRLDDLKIGADGKLYGLYGRSVVVPLDELGRTYLELGRSNSLADITVRGYSFEAPLRDFAVDGNGNVVALFEDGSSVRVEAKSTPNNYFFSKLPEAELGLASGTFPPDYIYNDTQDVIVPFFGESDLFTNGQTPLELGEEYLHTADKALQAADGARLVLTDMGQVWFGTTTQIGDADDGQTTYTWTRWNLPASIDPQSVELFVDGNGEPIIQARRAQGGEVVYVRGNAQGLVRELAFPTSTGLPGNGGATGGIVPMSRIVVDKNGVYYGLSEAGNLYKSEADGNGRLTWANIQPPDMTITDLDLDPAGAILVAAKDGFAYEVDDAAAQTWKQVDRTAHAATTDNLFKRSTADSKAFNFDANILRSDISTAVKRQILAEAEQSAEVVIAGLKERAYRTIPEALATKIFYPGGRRIWNWGANFASWLSHPVTGTKNFGAAVIERLQKIYANVFSRGNVADAASDLALAKFWHAKELQRNRDFIASRREIPAGTLATLRGVTVTSGGQQQSLFDLMSTDMDETLYRLEQALGSNRDDWGKSATYKSMNHWWTGKIETNLIDVLIDARKKIVGEGVADDVLTHLDAMKAKGIFIAASDVYGSYSLFAGQLLEQQQVLNKMLTGLQNIAEDATIADKDAAAKAAAESARRLYDASPVTLFGKTGHSDYTNAAMGMKAFSHIRNNLQVEHHRVATVGTFDGKLTENRTEKLISMFEGMDTGGYIKLDSNWKNTFRPAFRAMRLFEAGYTGATIYAGLRKTTDYNIKIVKTANGLKLSIGSEVDWAGILKARPWAGEAGTFNFDVDFDFAVGLEAGKSWDSIATFTFENGEKDKLRRVLEGLFENKLSNTELLALADTGEASRSSTTKAKLNASIGNTLLHGQNQGDLGAPNEFISSDNIDGPVYDKQVFYYQNMIYGANPEYTWDLVNYTGTTGYSSSADNSGQYALSTKSKVEYFKSHGWDTSLIFYQRLRVQGRQYGADGDEIQRLGMPIEPVLGSLSLNGTTYDKSGDPGLYNYALVSNNGYKMSYTPVVDAQTGTRRDVLRDVSYSVTFARDGNVFNIERIKTLLNSLPKAQAEKLRGDLVNMVSFTTEANRNQVAERLHQIVLRKPELSAQVQLLLGIAKFTRAEEKTLFERELRRIVDQSPELTDIVAQIVDENLNSDRWRPDNGATISISMGLGQDQIDRLNNPTAAEASIPLQNRIAMMVNQSSDVQLREISASETLSISETVTAGLIAEYKGNASVSTGTTLATLSFTEDAKGLRYNAAKSSGILLDSTRLAFTRAADDLTRFNALAGQDAMSRFASGHPTTLTALQTERDAIRKQIVLLDMEKNGTLQGYADAIYRLFDLTQADGSISDEEKARRIVVIEAFSKEGTESAVSRERLDQFIADIGLDAAGDDAKSLREVVGNYNDSLANARLDDLYPNGYPVNAVIILDADNLAGQIYVVGGEVYYIKQTPANNGDLTYTKLPADLVRKVVADQGQELLAAMHGYETGLVTLSDRKLFSAADIARLEAGDAAAPARATERQLAIANDLNRQLEIVSIAERYATSGMAPTPAEKFILMEFFGTDETGQNVDRDELRAVIKSPDALANFKQQVEELRAAALDVNDLDGKKPFEVIKQFEAADLARQKLGSDFTMTMQAVAMDLGKGYTITSNRQKHAQGNFFSTSNGQAAAMNRANIALAVSGSPTSLTDALTTASLIETLRTNGLASSGEIQRLEAFREKMMDMASSAVLTDVVDMGLTGLGVHVLDSVPPGGNFAIEIRGGYGSISIGTRVDANGKREFYLFDPLVNEIVISGDAVDAVLRGEGTAVQKNKLSYAISDTLAKYLDMRSGRVDEAGNPIKLSAHYGIDPAHLQTYAYDLATLRGADETGDLFEFLNGEKQPAAGEPKLSGQDIHKGFVLDRDRFTDDQKVTIDGEEIRLKTLYDMGAMLHGERINSTTDLSSEAAKRNLVFDPDVLASYLKRTADTMRNPNAGMSALSNFLGTAAPVPSSPLNGSATTKTAQEAKAVMRALRSRIGEVGTYAVLKYDPNTANYITALNMLNSIEFNVSASGGMGNVWDRLADPLSGDVKVTTPGSVVGRWGNYLDGVVGRVGLLQGFIGIGAFVRRKNVEGELSKEEKTMGRIAGVGLGLDLGSGKLELGMASAGRSILKSSYATSTKVGWLTRRVGNAMKSGASTLAFVSVGFDAYSAAASFKEVRNNDLDADTARFLRVNGGLSILSGALNVAMGISLAVGGAVATAAAAAFGIAGAVVAVSTMIYNAVKSVKQLKETYGVTLTRAEKAREGFRAFIGLGVSSKTKARLQREAERNLATKNFNLGLEVDAIRVFAEDELYALNNPLETAARVSHVVMSYGDKNNDQFEAYHKVRYRIYYSLKNPETGKWEHNKISQSEVMSVTNKVMIDLIEEEKKRIASIYGEENVVFAHYNEAHNFHESWSSRFIGDDSKFQYLTERKQTSDAPNTNGKNWDAFSYSNFSDSKVKGLYGAGGDLIQEYDIKSRLEIYSTANYAIIARKDYNVETDYVLWQLGGAADGQVDIMYGRADEANWFNIYDGQQRAYGGANDDRFVLQLQDADRGKTVSKTLVGNGGSDMLVLVEGDGKMASGERSIVYLISDEGDPTGNLLSTTPFGQFRAESIENFSGLEGTTDEVWGSEVDNVINGLGGNDELHGGAGADTIFLYQGDLGDGGTGGDVYVIQPAKDADSNPTSGRIVITEESTIEEVNAISLDYRLENVSAAVLVPVFAADGVTVLGYDVEIGLQNGNGQVTTLVLKDLFDAEGLYKDKNFVLQTKDGFALIPQFARDLVGDGATGTASGADLLTLHAQAFDGRFAVRYSVEADMSVELQANDYYYSAKVLDGAYVTLHAETGLVEVREETLLALNGGVAPGRILRSYTLPDRFILLTEGTDYRDDLRGTAGGDILNGKAGNDKLSGGDGQDVYAVTFNLEEDPDTGLHDETYHITSAGEVVILNETPGHEVEDENGDLVTQYDTDVIATNLRNDDMGLRRDEANPDDVLIYYAPDEASTRVIRLKNFMLGEEHRHIAVQDVDGTIWSIELDASGEPVFGFGIGEGTDPLEGEAGSDDTALNGRDDITAAERSVYIEGLGGDDLLRVGSYFDEVGNALGGDILNGGAGNDRLVGGAAASQLFGDEGDDVLISFDADDLLATGFGNDIVDLSRTKGGTKIIDTASARDGAGVTTELNRVILPFDIAADGVGFIRYESSLVIYAMFDLDGTGEREMLLVLSDYFTDGAKRAVQLEYHANLTGVPDDGVLDSAGATSVMTADALWRKAVHAGATSSDDVLFLTPEMLTTVSSTVKSFSAGEGHDIVVDDFTAQGAGVVHEIHGDGGTDQIFGRDGNDVIYGGDGDDILLGEEGDDILRGGAGDDYLEDMIGRNELYGEAGNDVLEGAGKLNGGAGSDTILGSDGNDELIAGNDAQGDVNYLQGYGGNDKLTGGAGRDFMNGGEGKDSVNGLAGDDVIYASPGKDILMGSAGHDVLSFEYVDEAVTGNFETRQFSGQWFSIDSVGRAKISSFEEAIGSDVDDDLTAGGETLILSGAGGSDHLIGTEGNDQLHAYYADAGGDGYESNWLEGKGGDDVLTGSSGDDMLDAGTGNDTIRLLGGVDWVLTGAGADVVDLRAASGLKVITTTAEEGEIDRLLLGFNPMFPSVLVERADGDMVISAYAEGAADPYLMLVLAGYFEDVAHERIALEFWDPAAGEDTPPLLVPTEILLAKVEGRLFATDGDDDLVLTNSDFIVLQNPDGGLHASFDAGDGDDTILYQPGEAPEQRTLVRREIDGGRGADAITSGAGVTHVFGGVGDDVILSTDAGTGVFGEDGNDVIGGEGLLDGGAGNDTLTGGAGSGTLIGGRGDDVLDGGAGDDTLDGGEGHDIVRGGDGDDLIHASSGLDVVDGGAGEDTLSFERADEGILFDMPGGVLDIESERRYGPMDFTSITGIERVIGSAHDDEIVGHEGLHHLEGGAGDDTLLGTDAADMLDGGTGDDLLIATGGGDTLIGGEGEDTLTFERMEEGAIFDLKTGLLPYGVSLVAIDGVEVLCLTRFADTVYGGTGFERIEAGAGNDILHGSIAGGTILDGDDGDDVFLAGAGGDIFIGAAGQDRVDFGTYSGGVSANFATQIFAALDEVVDGALGLQGVSGIEMVLGSAAGDTIVAGAGVTRIEGLGGNDVLSGSDADETILGDDGDDYVYVSAGTDTLYGNAGDNDVLSFERLDGGVNFEFEASQTFLTSATGSYALADVGSFEIAIGTDYADILSTGTQWSRTLRGGAGDDTLTSGTTKVDYLYGEDGDDTFVIIGREDVIDGGDGFDTVRLAFTPSGEFSFYEMTNWTSIEAVEGSDGDEYLNGSGAYASEVSSVHTIHGRGGNDRLKGTTSSDYLDGGSGNDHLYLRSSAGEDGVVDTVIGGSGYDILYVSTTYNTSLDVDFSQGGAVVWNSLGDKVIVQGIEEVWGEALRNDRIIADDHMVVLRGNEGDDYLKGNARDNLLIGDTNYASSSFSSDDEIWGEGGNDRIQGGHGQDELHGGDGDDLIYGQIDNDVLYGDAGRDQLWGDEGDDTLFGGAGEDVLRGGTGTDALYGEAGNDVLFVSKGRDVISGGDGFDILSFAEIGKGYVTTAAGTFNGAVFNGERPDESIMTDYEIASISGVEGLIGSAYSDKLVLGAAYEWVNAGAGDDYIYAEGSVKPIVVAGGAGKDIIAIGKNGDKAGGSDIYFGDGIIDITEVQKGNSVRSLRYGDMSQDKADIFYSWGRDEFLVGGGGDDVYNVTGASSSTGKDFGHVHILDAGGNDALNLATNKDTTNTAGAWNRVWFDREGEDLLILYNRESHDAGQTKVTVEGWFSAGSGDFKLEKITVDEINYIDAAGVDALVSAMQWYDPFEWNKAAGHNLTVTALASEQWKLAAA